MRNKKLTILAAGGILITTVVSLKWINSHTTNNTQPQPPTESSRDPSPNHGFHRILSRGEIEASLAGHIHGPHRPRRVSPDHFDLDFISKIRESMMWVPIVREGPSRPKTPIRDAAEALSIVEELIQLPISTRHPHSYCNGEEFFLFWGTHTDSPTRGIAVRKSDKRLLLWTLNDDHYWDELNPDRLTSNLKLLRGYFRHDKDPEEWRRQVFQEQKEAEHFAAIQARKNREWSAEVRRKEKEAAAKANR